MTEEEKDNNDKVVNLREITKETLGDILDLEVSEEQENFVADNSDSISEAYFTTTAWFRAIYADETPVGFVMINDIPGEYYLWRFMIDARYQGKGYGKQALKLVIQHVKTLPKATEFTTSHVKGNDRAACLYQKFGFEYTGEEEDGELVMKLDLSLSD